MKIYTILFPGLLLLASFSLFAESNAGGAFDRNSKILESGDLLSVSYADKTFPSASYFSTRPAERSRLAKRMLNILKETNASKSIIDFAKSRLAEHPRLTRDDFKVALTDNDGVVHEFTYVSDIESGLYLLNYRRYSSP